MKYLHRNVPLLSVAQALMMTCNSLMVATAALVGYSLAEDKSLATLPLAAQFIAVMCTSIPAAMVMERIGRKKAFLLSCVFGVTGGILTSTAILVGNFWLFVFGILFVGIFNGFGSYYRFTAADSVELPYKSRAVSYTMLGGVVAAIAGPTLARYSREWIDGAEFAGSYLSAIGLYIGIFGVLGFLRIENENFGKTRGSYGGRPLRDIVLQPEYLVAVICGMLGYSVMSFVMTATPLAMNQASMMFDDTAIVIQWHVMAMFAPSFFTGSLIQRFGVLRIMFAGALFGIACVAINLAGEQFAHFLIALIFLGLSWNFLFVGATTLLTETYRPEERNKAQAVNDFVVFTSVSLGSLFSGALQNAFGWQAVNQGVLPPLVLIIVAIAWLKFHRTRLAN